MNWMNKGPWTERIQKHQLILWYYYNESFNKFPYLWNLLTKPLVNRVNLSPENLTSQSNWFIKSQMSQLWLVCSLPVLMVLCTPTGTGLIYDEKLFRGKTPSGATNLVRGGPSLCGFHLHNNHWCPLPLFQIYIVSREQYWSALHDIFKLLLLFHILVWFMQCA